VLLRNTSRERRRRAEIAAVKVGTIVQQMYGYIWQFGVVIVLLVGGKMVMDGKLSLGTLVAFDAYVLLLVFPMYDIGTFFVQGKRAGVSIRRLTDIEDVEPEIKETAKPVMLPSPHGGVETGAAAGSKGEPVDEIVFRSVLRFEDVSLSFAGGRKILDRVSFDVKPGAMVALVGRVGSGKSSVVNLIPRLIDPIEGRIMLDGVPLKELGLESLRNIIGYVPQEPLLFSDTILNNIRFHRDWITDGDISRAARVARLSQDMEAFPDGLQTKIGQRGVTLSGGQKQRIALARALAGKPKILILDDCTASLDAQTETALWEGLHELIPSCITIVISHRAATLERADQILVFERGVIVERGTHDELVQKRGVYHTLYELGKLEEEVGKGWEE
jgi:ATP-binding cassette subfamily B multidrug efflux pump